ncbi:MAG TPA: carbohydrate-binding family 9-like protein [Verrucomicrobiae bacterium]|nr:carbohydrate-binding family 9-like protein [Verrucomicrobiae bacterium]
MKSLCFLKTVPNYAPAILTFSLLLAPFAPALFASERAIWVEQMQPISPEQYVCRKAPATLSIDGKLNEPAWKEAEWTRDFVDIEGAAKPKPRFRTRAKMLWDDQFLYLAAELEEPHVWGTLTNHDSVIFHDPDFEVFLDPVGRTQPYYEFEMNALNTTWDLRLDKPYQDNGKAADAWEIIGAKSAVHIDGTLNQPSDTDQGWTVEIAFPWTAFAERARLGNAPKEAEQWRISFSRVEWQIVITNGAYQKIPKTPENNWVWSPQGVIDMHRPEMWGIVQFTSRPAKEVIQVTPLPGKAARDCALEIYHAQRDFNKANQRWATNLAGLNWTASKSAAGIDAPRLKTTADGYTCTVGFRENGRHRSWQIRQDRLLTLDGR